jgi:hypothetical protein
VLRIRIQGVDDQKLKKYTTEEKKYTYPRPTEMTSKLQEKPSALKAEHPVLQKIKI